MSTATIFTRRVGLKAIKIVGDFSRDTTEPEKTERCGSIKKKELNELFFKQKENTNCFDCHLERKGNKIGERENKNNIDTKSW